ncbi:protein farnesyltransferase/geranylgeranyltransferase type-1 subunit alpha [Scaptodrosophila lebanonensis]|uniref:Protein farnesyltransferase/geranylgeranyltransferase type-1 subunit alpha n=1 Tax=Drosophila lebanonensis TaxID=7225 RepID=A0A6J2U6R6_DROLE|nr:protein farnesyltransferase/geranylgeranyltransferase type-1 subunit alpha [Scaptodrosophila lebanonensis]
MSDSSDEEYLGTDWLPYSERSEWADVKPLPQDDGPNPVVAIAYSPKFREVFDYFRAIIASREKTWRALELTTDALRLNPANYTVWQYRRDILRELDANLKNELDYLTEVIGQNAKNYQVWHHRRVIVEMLNDASQELELTQNALDIDAKNYHAWQHRQWAIRTFNLYDDELPFVDRLICEDQRNNSAWNQRFFVLKHLGFTPEVIQRELVYTMNRIRIIKGNESAWNYLVGVLRQSEDGLLSSYPEVLEFSEELYNAGNRSPYLLAFLIDVYQEQALQDGANEQLARKVYTLCDDMATKHDVIRRKYWQYVAANLKSQLSSKSAK